MKDFFKKIIQFIKFLAHKFKLWFRATEITIDDGTVVVSPKPIMPYIILIVLFLIIISARSTDFGLINILLRIFNTESGPYAYVKTFFPVDWSSYTVIIPKLIETIQMSFLGTFAGAILALPAAYFASSNITKNKFVVNGVRFLMSALRTMPILVYAQLFVFIFFGGPFTGTLAIALFTFSIVTKMLYERIEDVDLGAFHAIQSTGASKLKSFITGVMPSILPVYLSLSLYAFEINIRYAAILDYVGAGGIGFILEQALKDKTERVVIFIIMIFIVVILIENTSRYLRKKLG